ncbi:UNVERIFIED_CONTAM: hypothetical protein FKN15_021108 [Acipenser sinensis]
MLRVSSVLYECVSSPALPLLSGIRSLLLAGLPDEVFLYLSRLQYVYLANNRLTVAPRFLPESLRIADLAANALTEVYPLTFGGKPHLR